MAFSQDKKITVARDGTHLFVETFYENGEKKAVYTVIRDENGEFTNIKDGLCKSWYENGQLMNKSFYKNGRSDGKYESWWENGQKWIECTYKNGEKEGKFHNWLEDGKKYLECTYKNGKKVDEPTVSKDEEDNNKNSLSQHKTIKIFHDNGNKRIVYTVIRDGNIKDGLYEAWYENGQLHEKRSYKNGVLEGDCLCWYKNGQIWDKCTYKNGKKDGKSQTWHPDGQKWTKCSYKNGELDGRYRWWNSDGELENDCVYKNGVEVKEPATSNNEDSLSQHKIIETFYNSGEKKAVYTVMRDKNGEFTDDIRDGSYEAWFRNGQLWEKCFFKNGELEGEYQYWHPNGQKCQECTYKNGKIDGLCKWWSCDGELREHMFKNGVGVEVKEPATTKDNAEDDNAEDDNKDSLSQHKTIETFYENGEKKEVYTVMRDENGEFTDIKDGLCEVWYENGRLTRKYFYKNGKKEGKYESWYENGQKCQDCTYKNDKIDGKYQEWFEDGRIWIESTYKNGEKVEEPVASKDDVDEDNVEDNNKDPSQHKIFEIFYYCDKEKVVCTIMRDENGELAGIKGGFYEAWYKDGQLYTKSLHGCKYGKIVEESIIIDIDSLPQRKTINSFHYNGEKESTYTITRDENGEFARDGSYKEWYPNGQIEVDCTYKNGKLDGKYQLWHEDGQISLECTYKNGEKEGSYQFWLSGGQLEEDCTYKNGEKDSLSQHKIIKTFYKNNRKKEVYTIMRDENGEFTDTKDGKYQQWYENGRLCIDCTYKNGKLDGKYLFSRRNGQKAKECTYENGKLEGNHRAWYYDGNGYEDNIYKNGKKIGETVIGSQTNDKWGVSPPQHETVESFHPGCDNKKEMTYTIIRDENGKIIKDGLCQGWHVDGKKWVEYTWKNGKIDGRYQRWDEYGQLEKDCIYTNGEIIENFDDAHYFGFEDDFDTDELLIADKIVEKKAPNLTLFPRQKNIYSIMAEISGFTKPMFIPNESSACSTKFASLLEIEGIRIVPAKPFSRKILETFKYVVVPYGTKYENMYDIEKSTGIFILQLSENNIEYGITKCKKQIVVGEDIDRVKYMVEVMGFTQQEF